MTVTLEIEDGTNILEVGLSGKLAASDYDALSSQVQRMLKSLRHLRVLITLRRFEGWEAGASWTDAAASLRHLKQVDQLAIVGDERWEEGVERFARPFGDAKVQFFPESRLDLARVWLRRASKA